MSLVTTTEVPTHDNTMLSSYHYCERRYALEHILHKVSIYTSTALSFGKVIHSGFDKYYSAIVDGQKFLEAAKISLEHVESLEYQDPMEENDLRTKGRALLTLTEYFSNYREDPDFEILHTETPFDIETEDGFRYGGVIDLIVLYKGKIYVLDHKTTTRLDKYFFENFKRSPQMIGYTFSGRQFGDDLAGAIINCIALRTKDNRFLRAQTPGDVDTITYSDHVIEDWKRSVQEDYVQISHKRERHYADIDNGSTELEACMSTDNWKPNFHSCVGKYGRCPFWSVCHTKPEKREEVMYLDYKTHIWDWTDADD